MNHYRYMVCKNNNMWPISIPWRNTVPESKVICYSDIYIYILRYSIVIVCQSAFLHRREWRLRRTRATMIGYCYFLNVAAVVCGLPSITSAADHVAWSVIHSESDSTVLRNETNGAPSNAVNEIVNVVWWLTDDHRFSSTSYPPSRSGNWSDSLIRNVENLRNFDEGR